jgi:spoIIIJ-associated protein
MSEVIRVTGKTVEDAITNATIRLGVTSDHIVYTVIEHESKGFLGLGQKDAVIEVRIKTEADYEAQKLREKAQEVVSSIREEVVHTASEPVPEEVAEEVEEAMETEAAQTEAAPETERTEEQEEAAPVSRKREREIRPLENPQEATDKAENFLRDVYGAMGMDVELISDYDGEGLNIQMNGEDMGILIGKRGQTLDSLQYLVSLVVNKGSSTYVRVKLDTENYRERRKATLENLAKNISVKVKKTRQSVYLEPMNPYERRIIHSALQSDPFVTTHSEGEEPDRKVVVTLKADADLDALDKKYGEKHYRSGRGSYRGGRRGGRKGYNRHHEDSYSENGEQIEPVQIPDTGSADSSSID